MSLEAIEEIRGVEEEMDQARAQARAQAQKVLADAQREGEELLEQSRRASAEKTRNVLRTARERGEERRGEILARAEEDCRALDQLAQANMAQAVEMIVERVVDG